MINFLQIWATSIAITLPFLVLVWIVVADGTGPDSSDSRLVVKIWFMLAFIPVAFPFILIWLFRYAFIDKDDNRA